jgi:ATP-dependent RNA helicase HelY
VLALASSRELVRLGPGDFAGTPRAIGTVELPRPYAPRSAHFRREVVDALRDLRSRGALHERTQDEPDGAEDGEGTRRLLEQHDVAGCPDLATHLRAATAADRLERDAARLERRVRGRNESLARQFDRVLLVLESWGYLDEWALTDAGTRLARIYSESDLLIAEALREGTLDGLTPAELAAVVSCFTYERRGPEAARPMAPTRWPSSKSAQRVRAVERLWHDLAANEDDAGLPETRAPDPGLVWAIHAWADGDSLADILDEDDELTGGDLVRHIKQVIDLLAQLADVAPRPETVECARGAAVACFRGVVAASSVVHT